MDFLKNNTKRKVRAFSGGILLFFLFLVLLSSILLLSLPKNENIVKTTVSSARTAGGYIPDGEQANADKITGYFMDIYLEGTKSNCYDYVNKKNSGEYGLNVFSRTSINTTVIVTFSDVTYKDKPVFVSESTIVNFPARVYKGDNVDILGNLCVALHESFYNLFTQKFGYIDNDIKTANVQLMVLLGNNGLPLYKRGTSVANVTNMTFSVKAKIYKKDVPADVNDPDSPNYIPVGGGGINANPDVDDNDFLTWFNNLPQWAKISGYVLLGIAGLAAVGLVIKFLKWFFGVIFG